MPSKGFKVALAISVVLLMAWLMLRVGSEVPSPIPDAPTAQPLAHLQSVTATTDVEVAGVARPAANKVASVRGSLYAGDDREWLRVMPDLMRLDAASLWLLLSEPGIGEQLLAKEIKSDVLRSCLPLLHPEIEMLRADPTLPYNAGAHEWCKGLQAVGTWDALSEIYRALSGDVDLQTSDAAVLWRVNPDQRATPEDLRVISDALHTSSNPFELEAAAASFVYYRGGPGKGEDLGLVAMNPSQLSHLKSAIPARFACEVARSCGANSIWTRRYCLSRPGLVCRPGATFDEALAQNLSPVELEVLRRTLAWLRQTRRHSERTVGAGHR